MIQLLLVAVGILLVTALIKYIIMFVVKVLISKLLVLASSVFALVNIIRFNINVSKAAPALWEISQSGDFSEFETVAGSTVDSIELLTLALIFMFVTSVISIIKSAVCGINVAFPIINTVLAVAGFILRLNLNDFASFENLAVNLDFAVAGGEVTCMPFAYGVLAVVILNIIIWIIGSAVFANAD